MDPQVLYSVLESLDQMQQGGFNQRPPDSIRPMTIQDFETFVQGFSVPMMERYTEAIRWRP
jgi:hypothetical protein